MNNEKKIGNVSSLSPKILAQLEDLVKNKLELEAANTKKPVTNTGLKGIVKSAGNMLKSVAPDLIGLIPGVGPIAKTMLSTLNDDEWFSEFTAAGATFNELIQTDKAGPVYRLLPAYAEIITDVSWNTFKDDVMPSMLAFVRNKTNNVLASEVEDYSVAAAAALDLYAVYYTLGKFLKFAEDLPLNIPQPTKLIPVIRPEALSQAKGIHEALSYYLKTAVRMPYAITEYIRWRFGTAFMSSNTGKPGFIFYNANINYHWISDGDSQEFLNALTAVIESKQATISTVSRAMSDFKVAYDDHQIRYDVEKKHYDEKEFNLRTNFNIYGTKRTKYDFNANLYTLFLDSRLSMSPAVQAVTLSTGLTAPFRVTESPRIAWYMTSSLQFPLGTSEVNIPQGWNWATFQFDTQYVAKGQYSYVDGVAGAPDAVVYSCDTTTIYEGTASNYFFRLMAAMMADALQIHSTGNLIAIATAEGNVAQLTNTNLAYDRAAITEEQMNSIHRIAVRNLFRGNYKTKTPPTQRVEVKEAISEVEKEVINEIS